MTALAGHLLWGWNWTAFDRFFLTVVSCFFSTDSINFIRFRSIMFKGNLDPELRTVLLLLKPFGSGQLSAGRSCPSSGSGTRLIVTWIKIVIVVGLLRLRTMPGRALHCCLWWSQLCPERFLWFFEKWSSPRSLEFPFLRRVVAIFNTSSSWLFSFSFSTSNKSATLSSRHLFLLAVTFLMWHLFCSGS